MYLLGQAIYYSELADEPLYRNKAQVNMDNISFRSDLPPLPS